MQYIQSIRLNKFIINQNKNNIQKMINIQLLQRQRIRLYRNDLRRQFQEKQQNSKNQSLQLRSRDQQDLKQKLDVTMRESKHQKQRDFILKNKLKQQNMTLSTIKNKHKQLQESNKQQVPLKGSNLMENLYQNSERRGHQARHIAKKLSRQNYEQQNFVKSVNKQVKTHELAQQQRHLDRLKQLQQLRRQQYQQIKNRHSMQPKVAFQMHRKLQQLNEQNRKQLQNFTYKGRDILDFLKRDESKQMFQRKKRVQSQLKSQMEEKKIKDYTQRNQYIVQPDDLRRSMLGNVLFKDQQPDKKQYVDYLRKQMNQNDLRRSSQRMQNKQKIHIDSIFGGQGGPQRLKMMKYIDQNLGIQSQYLKKLQPGSKSNSPFRASNIHEYNGQGLPHKYVIPNPEGSRQRNQNPQKSHTEAIDIKQDMSRKTQHPSEQAIRSSSSQLNKQSPKSYVRYDIIKGSQARYQF